MRPFAFPKTRRLLNAQQVQGVFDNVDCKQGGKYFTLLSRSSENAESRLGIIVAKRHVKTAVKRNAIKRRIRDTFRHAVGGDNSRQISFDVIVLAKASCAGLQKQDISAELNRQWLKLLKKREARSKP
ncbi:MAG: ribonuclease P protein component [Gammaproteobacteria bacterium]|nr:ribonuclease P protein component [Gammaproteobacteria bacterium]NND37970.1 ribonuclease P protein component [Pseudomonadales bacterium]MBT8150344.1 ribonuclease P protein component [Gammaproteobacteria bacterium]NNL11204.1 ribonuclease P protein component [Pseudomonadales bacterium]NNM11226.1 ribonuclease P protein component [Pseudomonadales bacterium]